MAGGKTGKLVKAVLALEGSSESMGVYAEALRGRVERARRWMGRG